MHFISTRISSRYILSSMFVSIVQIVIAITLMSVAKLVIFCRTPLYIVIFYIIYSQLFHITIIIMSVAHYMPAAHID